LMFFLRAEGGWESEVSQFDEDNVYYCKDTL